MFTGIVESLGKIIFLVKESANLRIRISSPFLSELKVDQSISHNGVCLTVEKITGENYEVVAIAETLERSNLGELKSGDFVNLERCLKIGDRLDGHMVQGHVDETAVCKSVEDKIIGQASTPYLLRAVAEFTQGATVVANEKLLLANATLAAQVALELIEKQA